MFKSQARVKHSDGHLTTAIRNQMILKMINRNSFGTGV